MVACDLKDNPNGLVYRNTICLSASSLIKIASIMEKVTKEVPP